MEKVSGHLLTTKLACMCIAVSVITMSPLGYGLKFITSIVHQLTKPLKTDAVLRHIKQNKLIRIRKLCFCHIQKKKKKSHPYSEKFGTPEKAQEQETDVCATLKLVHLLAVTLWILLSINFLSVKMH